MGSGVRKIAKKPRKPKDPAGVIIDAALSLAASEGWRHVTLADIAETAGLSLEELLERYCTKGAIIGGLISRVDASVLDGLAADGEANEGDSPKDRLFDVLMRRFDALTPYKDGLAAVLKDLPADPVAAACHVARVRRSMALMLDAAGIPSKGCAGALRVKGLALVYANTVRVWLRDDSPDLAKTMSELDRGLTWADRAAAFMGWRDSTNPS